MFDFSMYADDTCLILGIDRAKYDITMKNELEKVVDWFSSNELLLNITKTDYLHFGPHYNRCYIRGEYDLAELHNIAPQYIFLLDCNTFLRKYIVDKTNLCLIILIFY